MNGISSKGYTDRYMSPAKERRGSKVESGLRDKRDKVKSKRKEERQETFERYRKSQEALQSGIFSSGRKEENKPGFAYEKKQMKIFSYFQYK